MEAGAIKRKDEWIMFGKRLVVMVLCLVLVSGIAGAEIIPPYGEGQTGYQAVVLSERISIREAADTRAKVVTRLSYGTTVTVTNPINGWWECYLTENGPSAGWALDDYLLVNPSYYVTEKSTPVYAWNDTSAKKVGLLVAGTQLPIIRQMGKWLLVSLRGATGWIYASEIPSTMGNG